jgi:hypothetical protein
MHYFVQIEAKAGLHLELTNAYRAEDLHRKDVEVSGGTSRFGTTSAASLAACTSLALLSGAAEP